MENLGCPFKHLFEVINKKWSILTLAVLGTKGTIGFNDLKNELSGITSRALSELLKVLEKELFIDKQRIKGLPPRVNYSLNSRGKDLLEVLRPLIKWAADETYHQHCEILTALEPLLTI